METERNHVGGLTIGFVEVQMGEDRADDKILDLADHCNVVLASRLAYNWIIGKGCGEPCYDGDLAYLKGTYERFGRRESLIIPGTFVEGRKDREDVLAFYNNKRISGFLDKNGKRVPKVFEAFGMKWGIEFGRELGVYANISVDALVIFPDCYVPEDCAAEKFTIIAREWYEEKEGERIRHLFEVRKKERWY